MGPVGSLAGELLPLKWRRVVWSQRLALDPAVVQERSMAFYAAGGILTSAQVTFWVGGFSAMGGVGGLCIAGHLAASVASVRLMPVGSPSPHKL